MTNTSVPQVMSFEEMRRLVIKMLEKTLQVDDPELRKDAFAVVRAFYEQVMKPRANLGKLDREYVNAVGKVLESIERKQSQQKGTLL